MNDISLQLSRTDSSISKAKGLAIKHSIRVDIPSNEKEGQEGFFMNFFNEVLLNFDKIDLKQKIFKNVGFLEQIFRLLEYCAGDYIGYLDSYEQPISSQYFSNEVLYGHDFRKKGVNSYLKLDICLKCILIMIFCTIKNKENQELLKEFINDKLTMLFELFYNSSTNVFKYFLTLLIKVYTENLNLLVQIPQTEVDLITRILSEFQKNLSTNPDISNYTILCAEKFSKFKDLSIFQNQLFISDILKHTTLTFSDSCIMNYIGMDLINYLNKFEEKDCTMSPSQFSPYLSTNDLKLINIPQNVILCT